VRSWLYVPPVTTMTLPLRSGISVSGLKFFGMLGECWKCACYFLFLVVIPVMGCL
jgi:hypothetical protein